MEFGNRSSEFADTQRAVGWSAGSIHVKGYVFSGTVLPFWFELLKSTTKRKNVNIFFSFYGTSTNFLATDTQKFTFFDYSAFFYNSVV